MTTTTADAAALPETAYIETTLNYRHPDFVEGGSAPRRDPRTMRVYDARPLVNRLALHANGFVLMRQPTAVTSFYDEQQVSTIYRAEVAELIKRLTGAEQVVSFRWKLRTSNPDKIDPRQEGPAEGVHIDYDLPTTRTFLRAVLGDAEADRLANRRLLQINVWRGITPVFRKPLAVCDARTVSPGDLHPGAIREKVPGMAVGAELHAKLAGYNPSYNPRHRWYYFPRMQPDEVLVLKLCDSDPSQPQLTAHSAIEDPTTPADAPHRESFEIRTIAILP